MATLLEDLTDIEEKAQGLVENKVANFAYTQEAYDNDDVAGVSEYDINKAQNIPIAEAEILDVNTTVLNKGYRSQASSITRMLMNHFLGRTSYNLNKSVDLFKKGFLGIKNALGKPNGLATLDSTGRIPDSQLPKSTIGYKGLWNAKTNTPTLADGTGTKGDFYTVSVAGTQNLGSGNIQFFENDWVIYNGSVWSRLSSGNIKTVNNIYPVEGNVTLTGENIPVSATDGTLLSKFKLKDIFSHLLGRFWTQSNITSGDFKFATYANGIWVASNYSKGLCYSQDGITWTQKDTYGSFNFATYANGIWVAGSLRNGLCYSQDGRTWSKKSGTSGEFTFATYANGIWVAGSSSKGLYYSQDGITWNQSNITRGDFNFATYANGIWVTSKADSNGLYYSQDGITWTQSNITSGEFTFATYANGIWVVGSYSKGLYYSQDGITWTQSNITSGKFKSATYANGIWVTGSSSNGFYYSQDGITWTQSNITSGDFEFATYANGIWVAGSSSKGLYYSQDGITWTQSNITSGNFNSATYANGIWVTGSSSNGFYYSQDGITWTQSNITSGNFSFATYANGIWVAGSYSKGFYYSDINTLIKNGWLVLSE